MVAPIENVPSPAELDAERSALDAAVGASGALDRSYRSLDVLEDRLGAALDAEVATRDRLVQRAELYVGEVLIANAGGVWAIRDHVSGRRLHVIDLPELGRFGFLPALVVNTFSRTRRRRILRDDTEVHDVPLRRRHTDRLLADAQAERRAFVADLRELAGADAAIDVDLASLDVVQRALAPLVTDGTDRDRVREVLDRAVLHVGAVIQAQRPAAAWSLCIEPVDRDLGQLTIDGFAPMYALRTLAPSDRAGHLRGVVSRELRARQRVRR